MSTVHCEAAVAPAEYRLGKRRGERALPDEKTQPSRRCSGSACNASGVGGRGQETAIAREGPIGEERVDVGMKSGEYRRRSEDASKVKMRIPVLEKRSSTCSSTALDAARGPQLVEVPLQHGHTALRRGLRGR